MENEQDEHVQFMQMVLEENPNPVLCVSHDGKLLYANKGSWLLMEYWKTKIGDIIPLEWKDIIQHVLESRREKEVEITIGVKTLLLHIVAIDGGSGCINVYGMDVTRRRHVEEKLRLNAQVIDNTTEGIMITDTDFRIIEINRAFSAITGYGREEVLGNR